MKFTPDGQQEKKGRGTFGKVEDIAEQGRAGYLAHINKQIEKVTAYMAQQRQIVDNWAPNLAGLIEIKS